MNQRLTQREREALQLVAGGNDGPATAQAMRLSIHTVKDHLTWARLKLGARTTAQAVALATKAGLIEVSA